jgi:predicted DNA-binding transcriptional regulator AlpA
MTQAASQFLLPDPKVCERYGVTPMTLWRWDHDPALEFPPPIRIKNRKYRNVGKLEAWERKRVAKTVKAKDARA